MGNTSVTHSIIIPCFNERESVPELLPKLVAVMERLGKPFELIVVDDGSTDGTFEELERFREREKRLKIIQFRRNLGKSAALSEGFRLAQGELIVTIDADLQNDPEDIPRLLAKLDEGYDVVSGWKKDRKDTLDRSFVSRIFNALIRRLFRVNLHDINNGLKAYRRQVVREIEVYGQLYRFIMLFAAVRGFRVTELVVSHVPRKYGKSKYGFGRLHRTFFDLMTVYFLARYRQSPLHFFGPAGLLLFLIGFGFGIYLTILKLQGQSIGGRPLLILAVLLILVGLQLIFTGLIAELLVRLSFRGEQYPIKRILQ